MKKTLLNFFSDKLYVELTITAVLFLIALSLDKLMDFIIYMLYFIIFLEIVRAVVNYVREQRVTMSLLVDAFIILALREFIVNVVKINKEELNSLDALFSSAVNLNLLILTPGGKLVKNHQEYELIIKIAQYAGARQNEIIQLTKEDIKQEKDSGIWYFDINANNGKKIKNIL